MQISDAHYSHLESIVDLAIQKQAEKNPKDRNAFTQIMLWEKEMKQLLNEKSQEGQDNSTQSNGKQQTKKEEQYEQ